MIYKVYKKFTKQIPMISLIISIIAITISIYSLYRAPINSSERIYYHLNLLDYYATVATNDCKSLSIFSCETSVIGLQEKIKEAKELIKIEQTLLLPEHYMKIMGTVIRAEAVLGQVKLNAEIQRQRTNGIKLDATLLK